MSERSPKAAKVCVLASGGVESTALIAAALKRRADVTPLYVASGFVWEKAEFAHLERICRKLASPRLSAPQKSAAPSARAIAPRWCTGAAPAPGVQSPDDAVGIPGRNLLLLAHAASFAAKRKIGRIEIGVLGSNPFPDATPAFLRSVQRAFSRALGAPLTIAAPLRGLKKRDVARRLDPSVLELTFSCLRPRGLKPCGACNKCAERARAAS